MGQPQAPCFHLDLISIHPKLSRDTGKDPTPQGRNPDDTGQKEPGWHRRRSQHWRTPSITTPPPAETTPLSSGLPSGTDTHGFRGKRVVAEWPRGCFSQKPLGSPGPDLGWRPWQ